MPSIIKSDPKAREKPCLRCGYSLRKLPDTRHCPECGLSIWISLNGNDSLDWSHPDWLKKIYAAVAIMALGQAIGFAAFILFVVPSKSLVGRRAMAELLFGAYFTVYGLGLFLLGAYEGRHPDKWKSVRVASWIVGPITTVFGILVLYRSFRSPRLFPFADPLIFTGTFLVIIANALCTWAYLRLLALRVPHSAIAKMCGYLIFIHAASAFSICFVSAEAETIFAYLPCAYFPLTIGLLTWFTFAFRRSAKSAERNWTTESAPQTPTPHV